MSRVESLKLFETDDPPEVPASASWSHDAIFEEPANNRRYAPPRPTKAVKAFVGQSLTVPDPETDATPIFSTSSGEGSDGDSSYAIKSHGDRAVAVSICISVIDAVDNWTGPMSQLARRAAKTLKATANRVAVPADVTVPMKTRLRVSNLVFFLCVLMGVGIAAEGYNAVGMALESGLFSNLAGAIGFVFCFVAQPLVSVHYLNHRASETERRRFEAWFRPIGVISGLLGIFLFSSTVGGNLDNDDFFSTEASNWTPSYGFLVGATMILLAMFNAAISSFIASALRSLAPTEMVPNPDHQSALDDWNEISAALTEAEGIKAEMCGYVEKAKEQEAAFLAAGKKKAEHQQKIVEARKSAAILNLVQAN